MAAGAQRAAKLQAALEQKGLYQQVTAPACRGTLWQMRV